MDTVLIQCHGPRNQRFNLAESSIIHQDTRLVQTRQLTTGNSKTQKMSIDTIIADSTPKKERLANKTSSKSSAAELEIDYPQVVSLTLPTIGQYLIRISCSLKGKNSQVGVETRKYMNVNYKI